MHYTYIDIGTADFETSLDVCAPGDTVLLVEPLFEHLARLPNGPNIFKANFAISERRGMARMYYVPPDMVTKHNLPAWLRGCSSLNRPHPTVTKFFESEAALLALGAHLVTVQPVPMITMDDLLQIYQVDSVDHLKIDTEGHDHVILFGLLVHMHRTRLFPKTITFERTPADAFGNNALLAELVTRFQAFGYRADAQSGDNCILCWHKDLCY